MTLKALEQALQNYILHGQTDIMPAIQSSATVDVKTRLDVYADAYRLRLTAALRTDFSHLDQQLGEVAFNEMAAAYMRAHPSSQPSIRWFGAHLADFLRHATPYREQPWLAEFAAFEWARSCVFDAADSSLVTLADMANLPANAWAELRLQFQPAQEQIRLHWNVPQHCQAADQDQAAELQHSEQAQTWLIWRHEFNPHWRSLPEDEVWALNRAQQGASFADICDGLQSWHAPEDIPLRAASFLKQWCVDGLLSAFNPE